MFQQFLALLMFAQSARTLRNSPIAWVLSFEESRSPRVNKREPAFCAAFDHVRANAAQVTDFLQEFGYPIRQVIGYWRDMAALASGF